MPIATVPANDRLAGPYTATAGQTVFPYDFPVFAAGDLRAVRRRAGVETVFTSGFDFTVTGVGQQAGGTVVLASGAQDGDIIAIYGADGGERVTQLQPPPNAPSSSDLNNELNATQIQLQELATRAARAVRLRDTDAAQELRLPLRADRANKLLGFDADGQPVALATGGPGAQGPAGPPGAVTAASSIALTRIADPAAPAAGIDLLYSDEEGRPAVKSPAGDKLYVTARPEHSVWVDGQAQALAHNDSSGGAKTVNAERIQAAIDWALSNGKQLTSLSSSILYCDAGPPEQEAALYLDPPGNLRSNWGAPGAWQFTLELRGAGGAGSKEPQSTQLRFTDATKPLVVFGPGQGLAASGFAIVGPEPASRAAIPEDGVGLGITGGIGGAHTTKISSVSVWNLRRGLVTGVNGRDVLADSNTFEKFTANNCYIGAQLAKSQNFITAFRDCVIGAKISVLADQGTPVLVDGGNFSLANALSAAFAISGTSGLSATTDNALGSSLLNYTFTTTIAAGDAALAAGDYDVFCVKTPAFGLIPLLLVSYNAGTGEAEMKTYQPWLASHYSLFSDIAGNTDLAGQIAAATKLYAAEQIVTFRGNAFAVRGLHLENQRSVTCLYDHVVGFAGAKKTVFDALFGNYDASQGGLAGGTDAEKAVFYCQQSFAFLRHLENDGATIAFRNSQIYGNDGIVIEVCGADRGLDVDANTRMPPPNIRAPLNTSFFSGEANNGARGVGIWEQTPFLPSAETTASGGMASYLRHRRSALRFQGFLPDPSSRPSIFASTLAAIEAGPGTIGDYPPLHGGTLYSVEDHGTVGAQASASQLIRSGHTGWGYGKNLIVDWSYVGQTHIVELSDLTRVFAGLVIILDNGVDGDQPYMVTGVYRSLGYITVQWIGNGTPGVYLAGNKTTTYTGATVKQAPYAISRIGTLPPVKAVTNATSGATTAAAGDLTGAAHQVNLVLSAVGAANYTTRTAAQMFADIPGAHVGMTYMVAIRNTSGGTTTLVAADGSVTISGTATIAAGVTRIFEVRFTSATACTITNKGALS